jgi:succinate dehydrogenase / fumarate reductase membrane anchor subunit
MTDHSPAQMRNMLGRVRGLGSAKEGVNHWWAQRLTAVALVPLVLWFVASVIGMIGAPLEVFRAWVRNPIDGVLLVALIVATFHHAQLGMQVVIEDYVHGEGTKLVSLLLIKAAALLLGLISIWAVVKLAFG